MSGKQDNVHDIMYNQGSEKSPNTGKTTGSKARGMDQKAKPPYTTDENVKGGDGVEENRAANILTGMASGDKPEPFGVQYHFERLAIETNLSTLRRYLADTFRAEDAEAVKRMDSELGQMMRRLKKL